MDNYLGLPTKVYREVPPSIWGWITTYGYQQRYIEQFYLQYRDGHISRVTNKGVLSSLAFNIGMDTYLGLPTKVYRAILPSI